MTGYLAGPGWRELATERVLGRPVQVWRERPRHVLDLLDLAPDREDLDLLVQGKRRHDLAGFRRAVERGAVELAGRGVRPGDRVLIVLYNSPAFLLAQWAAWRLGAVPVLGNRWWPAAAVAEVVDRVTPAAVVTDLPLSDALPPEEVTSWFDGRFDGPAAAEASRPTAAEDDVALIVFTAGSTGFPKGVQLSHRNLVWTQQTLHVLRSPAGEGRPAPPEAPERQPVALMTTPMFHNGAVVAGLSALIDGGRIVLPEGRFRADEVLELIERERVSSWNAVPTMFRRVLAAHAGQDLSSLVAPSTGGAMVPPSLVEEVGARLPGAGFALGYGMTEMSFISMVPGAEALRRPGTVGRPIPGVEVEVGPGGELLARSGALMVGYLDSGSPADTPIDRDGWYHTGDLGRIDDDGYLYLTGRARDQIIRGGENIACARVEAVLGAHPAVAEVAVVGYPDDEYGEAVAAHVYPAAEVTEPELAEYARANLAYFEVPSRWVLHDRPLPVLATGKVDKQSLAAGA